METALISLVCIAILLIGTVTTVFTSFRAATTVSDSLKQWEEQASNIRRTDISANGGFSGGYLEIWVTNNGQTNLKDFSKWDIIAQWTSGGTEYISYLTYVTSGPGDNQWLVEGLYLPDQAQVETLEPNIFNPQEKAKLIISLQPNLSHSTARITISTPNGVTSQCLVTRN